MKTLSKFIYLICISALIVACNKEELTFNPEIDENSTFDELLNTTSFFDRKETTFIITEEEYDRLIVSRDSTGFVFSGDDIFEDLSQYTHISYPYFSETPELFFMGKIEDLSQMGDQVSFSIKAAHYTDLYDDFLINTNLPNGYATTRDAENAIDLGVIYPKLLGLSLPEIPSYLAYIIDLIAPSSSSTFILGNELSFSPRGNMKGLISFICTPDVYGVNIENFELIDFGVESTFAEPDCDFPRLKQEIQDPPESSFFVSAYESAMSNPIADNLVFGDKTIYSKPIPATGCNVLLLLGIDFQRNGDFLTNLTAEINTKKPIDISIEFQSANPLDFTMKVEGSESNSLSKYITYQTDAYLGAKAEASFEISVGVGVSDLADFAQIGVLLGASLEGELTGQIGRADIDGTTSDYMNGCGSLKVNANGYAYGSLDSISSIFNIPNTARLFQTTMWDIAKDTKYANDATIKYTQVCHPDNCKDIITNNSYLRLDATGNDKFDLSYYIKNREDNPGTFSLKINSPTRTETIVLDGTYNVSGNLTATLTDENLSAALASQDQANLNFSVVDNFSGCEKTMPIIVFGTPCNTSTFSHSSTSIQLRAYNVDNESDQVNGTCTTSSDPIWTYENESLAALNNFAPDYQTINYMSYDRCQCFAEKLSEKEGKTFVIPTTSTMEQFASDTYDYYFAMVEGNQHCSNFVPSGYVTKSIINGCLDFFSLNQPLVPLYTQNCITSFENAYFHVENPGSDGLNHYLFQLDPESYITIKEVAKGTLAPCRLQILN